MSSAAEPKIVKTFTGETLLYNPDTHHYTTLDGEPLLSGSKYAEIFAEPFDKERLLKLTAKKLNTTEAFVEAAWEMKGLVARTFGTSLHMAMECWFRYRDIGYGISKHPFLKVAVESFPLRDGNVLPEIMVSDLKRGLVGQIDGLVLEVGAKVGSIIDYKSDANVEKNLKKHFNQLSFYAAILMAHGWKINKVQVWNLTDIWRCYQSDILPLKLGCD